MSTTTPHLSLLKPDPSELVSVVPQINENYDKLDAETLSLTNRIGTVEGVAGITPWASWVPTDFKIGAVVVAPTVVKAEFFKLGDLVFCDLILTDYAVASYADSNIQVSLPYEYASGYAGSATMVLDAAFPVVVNYSNLHTSNFTSGIEELDVVHFMKMSDTIAGITLAPGAVIDLAAGNEFRAAFHYRTTGVEL